MQRTKVQNMASVGLLVALLCIISPFTIPVGPVPISLGIFGVALMGAMLKPLWSLAGIAAYLLLGMAGLPVFTGFRAGPGVLFGVTGGYLIGYFLLALAISLAVSKGLRLPLAALCVAAGMGSCYLLGTLWYMLVSGSSFASGLLLCVVPFILPDLVKIGCAVALAAALRHRMERGRGAE